MQLIITEKERNVETNKLMHHTLAAVNNFKHRLDGLVSSSIISRNQIKKKNNFISTSFATSQWNDSKFVFILFCCCSFFFYVFQENRQHELNLIRERLKTFEMQANKLQYTVDLLYKCHHKPLIYCPQ